MNRMLFSSALVFSLATGAEPNPAIYSVEVLSIKGNKLDLTNYRGKAILIVNTASQCGYTSQLGDLQKLYEKYGKKGFVVIGMPSNDFRQEVMTDQNISKFCKLNYGVTFPLLRKSHVNGEKRHALYQYLIAKSDRPKEDIRWNFEKFLIGRRGEFLGRYSSSITPQNKTLLKDIEQALEK